MKQKIMIADDEQSVQKMLTRALESESYEFLSVSNGKDAVDTGPERAPHVAHHLASEFDRRVSRFYGSSDSLLGFVQVKNRRGDPERFPLISLSIGIVTNQVRNLDHYAKVVQIASEMKAYCKSPPERRFSRFAFDRRRD